jgi:hypothetical protein
MDHNYYTVAKADLQKWCQNAFQKMDNKKPWQILWHSNRNIFYTAEFNPMNDDDDVTI